MLPIGLYRSMGSFLEVRYGWLARSVWHCGGGVDSPSRLASLLLLFCASLVAAPSRAQTACYVYRSAVDGIQTPWQNAQGLVALDVANTCTANDAQFPGCGITSRSTSYTHTYNCFLGTVNATTGLGVVACTVVSTTAAGQVFTENLSSAAPIVRQADPKGCPVCPASGVAMRFSASNAYAPGENVCANDRCAYSGTGNGIDIHAGTASRIESVTSQGKPCSAVDVPTVSAPTPPVTPGNTCVTTAAGTVCDTANSSCGQVNGETVCITAAAPGECRSLPSGGSICVTDSAHPPATPPAPDTGVAGVIATPVASIVNNTVTANVYNSTTVAGSSGGTATAGSSGATTGTTPGTGTASTPGTGTASGGDTCGVAPSCTGDAIQCMVVKQQWLSRCNHGTEAERTSAMAAAGVTPSDVLPETEVQVSQITPLSGSLVSSCPPPLSLSIMGQSVNLDLSGPTCSALGMLRPVVLLIAWLSAAFILGGAVRGS